MFGTFPMIYCHGHILIMSKSATLFRLHNQIGSIHSLILTPFIYCNSIMKPNEKCHNATAYVGPLNCIKKKIFKYYFLQ